MFYDKLKKYERKGENYGISQHAKTMENAISTLLYRNTLQILKNKIMSLICYRNIADIFHTDA